MAKNAFHEVFEAGGLRVERHGRFMVTQSMRTPEQQAELIERLAEAHKELPSQIATKVERLEELLASLDPFDVIANLMVINTFHDPDSYKEYEMEGNVAYVEYVALLCVKRPRWTSDHRRLGKNELGPIVSLVEEIFQDTEFYYSAEAADPERDGPPGIVEEMRLATILNELVVRHPGYSHHLEEMLTKLFTPFDPWMREELGFSISEALKLANALERILLTRFKERLTTCHHELKALKREVRASKRDGLRDPRFPPELVAQLGALPEKKMLSQAKTFVYSGAYFALGDTFSVSANEAAEAAEVPTENATAFLEFFSLEFGDVDAGFTMPAPTHRLQTRPVLRDGTSFLCPSPQNLLWGLRPAPALEAAFKATPSWERYAKKRGDTLEAEVLTLLGKALPHAAVYGKLKYTDPSEPQVDFELDGLVLFDSVLMLVEAKAGAVKPAARRGGQKSMLQSLKDLVVDAHNQALRARTYINSVQEPVFRLEDGTELKLDKNSLDQTFIIAVTLDEVSVFSPMLHEMSELGLFEASELPWAVPYFDFRVICELTEFPSQLVHFLRRRKRLGELAFVSAHDELDYFGHYLIEGLYFEDLKGGPRSRVNLLSYTAAFDEYYFSEMGLTQKLVRKPRQKMPARMRALIQELEERRPQNYVSVVCALLDMDSKGRRSFFKLLDRITKATRKDRKLRDFSIMYDSEGKTRGITVMCAANADPEKLHQRLATYCAVKKYQLRCDSWIGLGHVAELPGTFHMAVTVEGQWKHDSRLETALEAMQLKGREIRLKARPRGGRLDQA